MLKKKHVQHPGCWVIRKAITTKTMIGQFFMKYFVLFIFVACITACKSGHDSIVESTGTIEATQVDIRSEVAGRILNLALDEGDRVKPGDMLAAIDHEKLDIELQNAEGVLREAEAHLSLLKSGFRKEDVQKAQEALLEAEILFGNAKREYERVQKLYADKVAPEQSRDSIETNYKSALKRYERAKQDYQMLQSGYRAEDIAAGQAARDCAEAAVNLVKRRIKDATVASPGKGIISERYVEPGELVSVGSVMFSIIDLQDMWIMAYVSEKNLGKVKIGQAAAVSVDSFPDRKFAGKVIYISPEAEFTPKNIQTKEERVKLVYGIKVQIQNDEELLKPGMPADVAIAIEPSK
jgi:HlyD family secretion protein